MKTRALILEGCVTGALALVFGFCLAAGARLDGGGYLGYGVEHYATNVFISWDEPAIYLETLLYALFVFIVLLLLWRALDWVAAARARRLLSQTQESNPQTGSLAPFLILIKKRWFWITALLLICCWLPFWLGVWPGVFNYDGHYQYEMITQGHLQTHHPLMHTFLLDGLILFGEHLLGSVNIGLALYIGVVLVVCALTFSWMLRIMAEEGAGKLLLGGSFLFLAVNPALVLVLVSTNKDVLFSAFLLLAALVLYRACRLRSWELQACESRRATGSDAHSSSKGDSPAAEPSALDLSLGQLTENSSGEDPVSADPSASFLRVEDRILRIGPRVAAALFWLVLAVLCFRTSAIHSFIVFLPFAAFLIRKHLRLRLMATMVGSTVAFLVLYVVLVMLVFRVPSGPWQALDALTIPRQQLARVWVQTEDSGEIAAYKAVFSTADLEELNTYEADIADPSRGAFLEAFQQRPLELLELYLNIGAAHPGTYTDAALLTSYEGWLPGAVTDGYVQDEYFAKPGQARSSYLDVSTFTPATEAWVLEDFGSWLKEFGFGNVGLDLAPVRLLCSPAVYMWILLIALARTICTRNRRGALVCTLLLIFGLTALLSPLVVMRYYLMVMVATPLLLHIASNPSWRRIVLNDGGGLRDP